MSRPEHESLTDYDASHALFGGDDALDHYDDAETGAFDDTPYRPTRADRKRWERETGHARKSRRGWVIVLVTIVVVGAVALLVVPRVRDYFTTKDYSGNGSGNPVVSVTVNAGDTASDIAQTLVDADVVESTTAFTDAADANPDSTSIQPGVYDLHTKQSGKTALIELLDPSSRNKSHDAVITEGANRFTVEDQLVKVLGDDQRDAVRTAMDQPSSLGLPQGYGSPKTAEGFLFPATYTIDPGNSAREALTAMVSRFIQADRDSGFAAGANDLGIEPYEALIVASIVQAEAKYDEDMPKVAEVIYNRLKNDTALQIDATTKYGCEIANEKNCIYNNFPTPYNSYLNKGLPPTPIDNPGAQAMAAAVQPAKGKLLFYVNGSKDGHLTFTTNEADFEKARQKCSDNNWGCA